MIIELLLNVIYNIIDTLLFFEIPSLPTEIFIYLENGFQYITAGAGILANYVPLSYFMTLFYLVIIVESCLLTYRFVMFVIAKIPAIAIR